MAWNPGTYNKYQSERAAPFYDLLNLVDKRPGMTAIDLGCGTGQTTRELADTLPVSKVLGIDSSEEMLKGSERFTDHVLNFERRSIEEQLKLNQKYDLVFSNAAIQWLGDHHTLLPQLIATVKPGGQLAIQMPAQHHNLSNTLLLQLAGEEPFQSALQSWNRVSPVLDIEVYARILFENGAGSITAFEKIYPLILEDTEALFDWVSGTALIPYTERLESSLREAFITRYKELLKKNFDTSPVFYPFRRIVLHACFN